MLRLAAACPHSGRLKNNLKRAQEKVKDLVEAQALAELQNFAENPSRALRSYLFTDATSDLFARWLDALAELSNNRGAARALGLSAAGRARLRRPAVGPAGAARDTSARPGSAARL